MTAASSPTPTIPATATPTGLAVAEVVRQAREAVVRVSGAEGGGTGFIVSADGYVLTNEHVIRGSTDLTVVLEDGRRFAPRIVGADLDADVALLKIDDGSNLAALPLATRMSEGEDVVALGYPLNNWDSITVTKGIISAFRTMDCVDCVQTDAAIYPGNSGGPLPNMNGEVVGMNTLIVQDTQGIGFAIAVHVLSNRIKKLKSDPAQRRTGEPHPRCCSGRYTARSSMKLKPMSMGSSHMSKPLI